MEGLIYSFGYSLHGPYRTTKKHKMTKFRLMRSGKGEIFWRKTLGNEAIVQLSDLEWLCLLIPVYPFCFDVSMNSKE